MILIFLIFNLVLKTYCIVNTTSQNDYNNDDKLIVLFQDSIKILKLIAFEENMHKDMSLNILKVHDNILELYETNSPFSMRFSKILTDFLEQALTIRHKKKEKQKNLKKIILVAKTDKVRF